MFGSARRRLCFGDDLRTRSAFPVSPVCPSWPPPKAQIRYPPDRALEGLVCAPKRASPESSVKWHLLVRRRGVAEAERSEAGTCPTLTPRSRHRPGRADHRVVPPLAGRIDAGLLRLLSNGQPLHNLFPASHRDLSFKNGFEPGEATGSPLPAPSRLYRTLRTQSVSGIFGTRVASMEAFAASKRAGLRP